MPTPHNSHIMPNLKFSKTKEKKEKGITPHRGLLHL